MRTPVSLLLVSFLFPLFCYNASSQTVSVDYKVEYGYRMKTDTATLTFNGKKSFFDCTNGFNNRFLVGSTDTQTKMKVKSESIMSVPTIVSVNDGCLTTKYVLYDQFKYSREQLGQIIWNEHDETREILGYLCQKATCTFRGRNYTAWFTRQIPNGEGFGPWKFNGLPGLILSVTEDTGNISIMAVNVNVHKFGRVKTINTRKAYTFEEYYQWMTEYVKALSVQTNLQKTNPKIEVTLDTSYLTEIL